MAVAAGEPQEAQRSAQTRRVLLISRDFPPARDIGAQACAQIARHLPTYGWDVVVLTVREQYIENLDVQQRQPFPGTVVRTRVVPHPLTVYKHLKSCVGREARGEGVHEASSAKMGTLRRWALSLLSLPDTYTGWIVPALISGLGAVRRQPVQCLFSSGPWWTNHLVGLLLARLTGLPWIAHFRDPWLPVQSQWLKPVSGLSIRLETALERTVIRRAQAVLCVTEPHTALLRHAYPELSPSKFVTIPNGYDGAEWDGLMSERTGQPPGPKDTFVITYAGNLYHRRNPLPLFRALRSLTESGDVARERVRVDLIGHCEEAEGTRVRQMVADSGLVGCVNITGPLGRAETLRRVVRSDLLLLLGEELTRQIPGKTYEYLRAGRPILALTSEGALADLLQRTGGAWVVDPADQAGTTVAVREAYRRWRDGLDGPRPDPSVVLGFDRRLLAGRFAAVFESSVGRMQS